MKALFGWIAELGWEVVEATPFVHALCEHYEVTVCSFQSSLGLYAYMPVRLVAHGLGSDRRFAGKGRSACFRVPPEQLV